MYAICWLARLVSPMNNHSFVVDVPNFVEREKFERVKSKYVKYTFLVHKFVCTLQVEYFGSIVRWGNEYPFLVEQFQNLSAIKDVKGDFELITC